MPLTYNEWFEQHKGIGGTPADYATEYARYYASFVPDDVEKAIADYEDTALKMYNEDGMSFLDVVAEAARYGYSLAAGKSVRFAEWCSLNYIWDHGNTWHNKNMKDINVYTTEQLYSIFKKESNG